MSGNDVIRDDPKPVIQRLAQQFVDKAAEGDIRRREIAEQAQYGARDSLYVMVEQLPVIRQSDRPRYRGTVVSGLPVNDRWEGVTLQVTDSSERLLLAEIRFTYAQLLVKKRECLTLEAARERAAHAEVVVAGRS